MHMLAGSMGMVHVELIGREIYFGTFPGWDNDDVNAITIIPPDTDGVVRSHPSQTVAWSLKLMQGRTPYRR